MLVAIGPVERGGIMVVTWPENSGSRFRIPLTPAECGRRPLELFPVSVTWAAPSDLELWVLQTQQRPPNRRQQKDTGSSAPSYFTIPEEPLFGAFIGAENKPVRAQSSR